MKVLWRKTLGMLIRFPSLLLTVVAVAAITAITAVAGPAFLESTERGSISSGVEQAGRWTAGLRVTYSTLIFDRRSTRVGAGQDEIDPSAPNEAVDDFYAFIDRMMPALEARMRDVDFIDGPELTLSGNPLDASGPDGDATLRLLHRADALDNVTMLKGGGNDGVWIADVTANALGLELGEDITLEGQAGKATTRIAGIYRYLPDEEPREYWTPVSAFIYRTPDQFTDPPALVLAGRETHEELMRGLKDWGSVSFAFPLTGEEMSLDQVQTLDAEFREFGDELLNSEGPLREAQGPLTLDAAFGRNEGANSALPGIARSAEERIEAVTPVVDLVSLAARLVAFSVMAAAGFFLVKKRRVEAASLAARGVGPLAQALRYGSEAFLPSGLGTLVGAGAGYLLVSFLGPAERLPVSVIGDAASLILSSVGIGLILLVGSAAFAVWREERNIAEIPAPLSGSRGLLAASVVAVAAGLAAFSMRHSISAVDLEGIRDPRLTLMPVILILAGATIGAALLRSALPVLARALRYRSPSVYLATRRLSGASGMTQVLVTASACALGIAIYGLAVSSSIREATLSKAQLFIGSDLSAQVGSSFEPPQVDFPLTHVTTFKRAHLADGYSISLMVIDPESFRETAYWRENFADEPLEGLLAAIEGAPGGPIEVLSTDDLGPNPQITSGSTSSDLEVVDLVRFFPGMPAEGALAIMSRDSFEEAIGSVGTLSSRRDNLWARGEPEKVEAGLLREEILFAAPITIRTVLDSPSLQSLLWMLGLLSALGASAAVISIFGLLLYLQARHRAALISSALTRRMGLTRRQEWVSWAAEIGGALTTAFVVAALVGLPVASLMKDRIDPRPGLPPAPVLIPPAIPLTLLGVLLIGVAFVGARRLQKSVDDADIAEVLRT